MNITTNFSTLPVVQEKTKNNTYKYKKFSKQYDTCKLSFQGRRSCDLRILDEFENDPNLKIYLDEIKRYKTIAKTETIELFKQMENGGENALKTREKLILANLGLVPYTILKWFKYPNNMQISDLIQEGNTALENAIDSFDLKKGYSFSTHAVSNIRFALIRKIEEETGLIKIPPELMNEAKKLQRLENKFISIHKKKPSNYQLAKFGHYQIWEIEAIKKLLLESVNIEKPIFSKNRDKNCFVLNNNFEATDDKRYTLLESLRTKSNSDIEKAIDLNSLKNVLNFIVSRILTEKEKIVLEKRFGLNNQTEETLAEIGKEIGLTRARIAQIEQKCLRKLKYKNAIKKMKEYL